MCLLGQTGNTELIYKAELYTKDENSDELFSCFFCVIEYYSVMFYDTKKLSGQAPYLYLFFFEIKI